MLCSHLHGGVHAGGDDLHGVRREEEIHQEGGGRVPGSELCGSGDGAAQLQVGGDTLELQHRPPCVSYLEAPFKHGFRA